MNLLQSYRHFDFIEIKISFAASIRGALFS